MSRATRPARHRPGVPGRRENRRENPSLLIAAAGGALSAQNSGSNPEQDSRERVSPGRAGSPGGDGSDSRCLGGITPVSSPNSLGGFQSRSPLFRRLSRSSSGYFSYDGDSVPSSPLLPRRETADKATQTPSPSSQVMDDALRRMAPAHGGVHGARGPDQQHGSPPIPARTRPPRTAGVMQAETIGRDLRRIGDDYNNLIEGRLAGRRVVMHPNMLPRVRQEPAFLLGVGLLLLLIGRMLYLQESRSSHQDHARV